MQSIELNHLEYGECIALCGSQDMLMVDCGSMNHKIREDSAGISQCFEEIVQRYLPYQSRYFLLTHYHRDHICGFLNIVRKNPDYFGRVFLPYIPVSSQGRPLLLEFSLYVSLFSQQHTDVVQMNSIGVRIFSLLHDLVETGRVFTLGAGDKFCFDEEEYEVLWPPKEDFLFQELLEDRLTMLASIMQKRFASMPWVYTAFEHAIEEYLTAYLKCCEICSVINEKSREDRKAVLEQLSAAAETLDMLRENVLFEELEKEIQKILLDETLMRSYSDSINSTSLVFQNVRKQEASVQDILMTGDISPDMMEKFSHCLYHEYYILKAPHHGTSSGYSTLFDEMSFSHILISNGDYSAGGAIAQQYIDREESLRHCTNNNACSWYAEMGSCCNRLIYCYEHSLNGGMALRCTAAQGIKTEPRCRITTVLHGKECACFCDLNHGVPWLASPPLLS